MHQTLLEQLREVFVCGEVAAGSKVPEAELCHRFSVSRTPLREALKVLASEGYIELLPNRGARVRSLTHEEIKGLFSVAGALEALAGEQACEHITAEELTALAELHHRMRLAYDGSDIPTYYALNREIHEAIVASTRNPVLVAQYAVLSGRMRRIRFASPMSAEIWSRAMAEHEGMLNALQRRDGAAMASILRTHLKHKSEAIMHSLQLAEATGTMSAASRRRDRSAPG